MRIVMLGPHFPPDTAPTGVVLGRIVTELAALGHEIEVITSLPWYTDHAIEPGWEGRPVRRENVEWGRISRVHPFPADKTNLLARGAAFGGFTALSGVVAGAVANADVVFAMSPPLTLGAAGIAAARRHRAPAVFNVQDVFPDVAIEVGAISGPRVIRAAQALERWTYVHSDAVTVLSDDLADNLRAKIAAKPGRGGTAKIRVIPNFVDVEAIQPADRMTGYRAELGLGDRTVVMYAGNIGWSQSLDMVLESAKSLAHRSDVVFLINGAGSAREELERSAASMDNVVFGDFQPAERLGEVLATGDLHLVPLRAGLARSSVPSKSYSVLAAGRPLVASVDADTEIDRMLTRSGAGLSSAPDDHRALTANLESLLDDSARRAAMGASGRSFVERWASPAAVAASYVDLFEELLQRRR